ncbi:MAG: aminoglycoside adenylyltransferase domain-containing protein [Dehalococcoidales bacterium]
MNGGQRRSPVCGWDDCPNETRRVVVSVLDDFKTILGDNLAGFYLHGSLTTGCFVPGDSDIDFLAVVKKKLTVEEKRSIIAGLLRRQGRPAAGDIEMSIVRQACLDDFAYPTPYEIHYSVDHAAEYAVGGEDYLTGGDDEDLAAHFTAVRHSGICLDGKPVVEAFPEVPREFFVRSLVGDADWILSDPQHNPLYTVLNLCRGLAFLVDGVYTSKKDGGEWGLEELPPEFTPVIGAALTRYSPDSAPIRPDSQRVRRFAEYAVPRIHSLPG